MMWRKKTEIELDETPTAEAARLRYALFVISGLDNFDEAKRVARAAISGQLHGHEFEPAVEIIQP